MPITLDAFLQSRRFNGNPFATTNAEQEREQLATYFVRVPWFEQLAGDPQHPESLILFAPQGYGKTSHRLEVARLAGQRRDTPALIVTFSDFDLLLQDHDQVHLEDYLVILRRLTLEALDAYLHQYPERSLRFQQDQALYARFCALLQNYVPLCLSRHPFTARLTNELVEAFQQTAMGTKEWLRILAQLAAAAGCASVYVLIDGVDEHTKTRNNLDLALRLLQPLLDAPGVLQECGFAFKFFLPDFLEALMRQQQVGRLDRIPVYHLQWNESDLRDMLSRRLTSFSLISATSNFGYVNAFSDLCEPAPGNSDVDTWLIAAAQSSPRKLLDLTRNIVEEHCRRVDDPQALIAIQTIIHMLPPAQGHTMPRELYPPPAPAVAPSDPPPAPPTPIDNTPPLLFFDARGDLWLGNQRCNSRPLPKQLRRCMQYLWNKRQRTVSYEELQQVLYGDTLAEREDPRSSLDKIIRRLRGVLQPGQPGSSTYIAVQPGTGYVLCHYAETPPDEA